MSLQHSKQLAYQFHSPNQKPLFSDNGVSSISSSLILLTISDDTEEVPTGSLSFIISDKDSLEQHRQQQRLNKRIHLRQERFNIVQVHNCVAGGRKPRRSKKWLLALRWVYRQG
mmetsp:Transcript_10860/g.17993  ORF Transcript_10860/g.17993 Transcript_10860/m.17993 type:complete len:114 (+) Transcript_10860:58-399(+)